MKVMRSFLKMIEKEEGRDTVVVARFNSVTLMLLRSGRDGPHSDP